MKGSESMFSDDPLRDFHRYDAYKEKLLQRLPICADCGEHIQDEYAYRIYEDWICESCMENYRYSIPFEEEGENLYDCDCW